MKCERKFLDAIVLDRINQPERIALGKNNYISSLELSAIHSGIALYDKRIHALYDYTQLDKKEYFIYTGVLLPDSAPGCFYDRSILWNAAEDMDQSDDAKICVDIKMDLPVGLSYETYQSVTLNFIRDVFLKCGMIADVNIHDKPNKPHAHCVSPLFNVGEDGFIKRCHEWSEKATFNMWDELWAQCFEERSKEEVIA